MIGCYATGILPRTKELVKATRAYERGRINKGKLESAFEKATQKAVSVQLSAGFTYITDGMLKWQDLLRPLTENLGGVKTGNLARWFNNNMFYRKPIVYNRVVREKNIVAPITYTKFLPKNSQWKAVLPAPYTFIQLSEIQTSRDKKELMFEYAKILRQEIVSLAKIGFKYVQLSDPALIYEPIVTSTSRDKLNMVKETLKIAVEGTPMKTCLQTFFGDFSQILPEALDFPVDHLGIDLYETNLEKLVEYSFDKGIALGLVDSRSSMTENSNELAKVAKKIINSIYPSKQKEVFICPNCDLEFLPWERAEEKMKVIGNVTELLKKEYYE